MMVRMVMMVMMMMISSPIVASWSIITIYISHTQTKNSFKTTTNHTNSIIVVIGRMHIQKIRIHT